jgi:hypothetical protein
MAIANMNPTGNNANAATGPSIVAEIERLTIDAESGIVDCEHEPRGVYYVREGSKLTRVVAQLRPETQSAQSLTTIGAFANRFKESSIWIDGGATDKSIVKLLMKDRSDQDRITIELAYSEPFKALVKLVKDWKQGFNQADLVLALRTTFARTFDASFLECVRRLKFRTAAETSGEIQKGKASVGRQVEQEVTGATALAEELKFRVPVYASGHHCYVDILTAIDVNLQTEKLLIIPLPGEIENALNEARELIASELLGMLDDNNPVASRVYFGSPT